MKTGIGKNRKRWPAALVAVAMASGTLFAAGSAAAAQNSIFTETGGWPIPPTYQGNPYASGGNGPGDVFYDNLIQGIRSSNQVFMRLAASYQNTPTETIIHLRTNDHWNTGQPFTSKDVWAVLTLDAQGQQISNYLSGIETPNPSTVILKWIAPYPNDTTRLFLMEQPQMNLPYYYYKTYVNKAAQILASSPKYTGGVPNLGNNYMGHMFDAKTQAEWTKNWDAFTKFGPKLPIVDGPYQVQTVTPTDMLAIRNPGYWDPQAYAFNELHFIQLNSGNSNEQYNLLSAGKIDRVDGTPPQNLLQSVLASNPNIVHYQMMDAATVGFVFNLYQPVMKNIKVREAIMYALNRNAIRQVSNVYGFNVPWSGVGMPDWELKTYVPQKVQNMMTHFTYDPSMAAKLLESAGWKKIKGEWHDPQGKVPSLTFACDASWNPQWLNAGEVAAEQLTAFGLPTSFRTLPDSIYFSKLGQKDSTSPDMALNWVDVSWGNTSPWNSLGSTFGELTSEGGMATTKQGNVAWVGKGYDGQTVDPYAMLNELPFIKSKAERHHIYSELAYVINQNVWTGDLYLNVTGAWFNMKDVAGLPWMQGVKQYNRNVPLPPAQWAAQVALLNEGFAGNIMYQVIKPAN